MRFIKQADYSGYIKPDILKQVTGTTDPSEPSTAQIRAEDTAIATITEYLGGRYDCTAIFTPVTGDSDTRNLHIVKMVVALSLYDLYHQTGMKDIPEHRKVAYDDAISWLKDAGRGSIKTTLPVIDENTAEGDIRFSTRKKRNNYW